MSLVQNKINLLHLDEEQLRSSVESIGEKAFRAKQIWNWLYVKGVDDISLMTNISKESREKLAEKLCIEKPQISQDHKSSDGTRKFLVKFFDGREVEMVFIPEVKRGTLCISSQVGCTLACKFCHTGTQTLVRNLEFHEIVAQILLAKDALKDWGKNPKLITNIVFMGMGEPFFNYENVSRAVKILLDIGGLDFSSRKITVSTSGLVPEIKDAAIEMKVNLAISLHATNDILRSEIMAINKKYPLKELLLACRYYEKHTRGDITFEYVMLRDINDLDEHALELASLITKYKLSAKVNLIPFNPWDGCPYLCSKGKQIEHFQNILKERGIITTIRKTRGDDVMAACGQLKSISQRVGKWKERGNTNSHLSGPKASSGT